MTLTDGAEGRAMPNLTEFLLARIAEDEAVALAADGGEAPTTHLLGFLAGSALSEGDRLAVHPARVLAECEAKRRIVADLTDSGQARLDIDGERIVAFLALPYADHPSWREEWRC